MECSLFIPIEEVVGVNVICINISYLLFINSFTVEALIWSLSYFIAGIFRSRLAGRVSRVFFFWLRFFDGLIPYSHNIDAACGIYFLGEKDSAPILNNSIIDYYQGAQKLK